MSRSKKSWFFIGGVVCSTAIYYYYYYYYYYYCDETLYQSIGLSECFLTIHSLFSTFCHSRSHELENDHYYCR
jgi:CDP-diglyceride synthetase